MATFPAFPLWTDAYLADTRHLTTAEHGAYLLLLFEAWRRPTCSLPDDDDLLCRLTGMSAEAWAASKDTILAFWKRDGRSKTWTQRRQKKERDRAATFSKSQAGKAAKRWKAEEKADAPAVPQQSRGNASISNSTIPNGMGAVAPPDEPVKAIFDAGVRLLVGAGLADRTSRALIGKWRRAHGDAWTREAIIAAEGRSDPVAWIEARGKSAVASEEDSRAASAATAERYRRLAIPGPEDWARAHGEANRREGGKR